MSRDEPVQKNGDNRQRAVEAESVSLIKRAKISRSATPPSANQKPMSLQKDAK
jgi:hypothetical protein